MRALPLLLSKSPRRGINTNELAGLEEIYLYRKRIKIFIINGYERTKPTSRSTSQNAATAACPISGARPGLEGGFGEDGVCTRAHK